MYTIFIPVYHETTQATQSGATVYRVEMVPFRKLKATNQAAALKEAKAYHIAPIVGLSGSVQ